MKKIQPDKLTADIKLWAKDLGFQQLGVSHIDLHEAEQHLLTWLDKQYHGNMDYMARHGLKRSRPDLLEAGTLSVLSVRMDYLPESHERMENQLNSPHRAYISRYALGRDYHKVMRKRLQKLATQITQHIGDFQYRVFVDSAPVLEKPLAVQAGLGWMGKHTNLINQNGGSWFFLGEIYTDLPLEADGVVANHCGSCQACLDVCPTQAIVAPYQLDARRCISYLTIELRDSIPVEFRPLIGNRVYGCDDCQLICPWNRFAQSTLEDDFHPRADLQQADLIALFQWTEEEFLQRLQGSPIRRIGYACWLRNIAVALGNSPPRQAAIMALKARLDIDDEMVKEHIVWALQQLGACRT